MNLSAINHLFSTKEQCRELLKRLRWPKSVHCPRCDHDAVCWLNTQEKYECFKCSYQFSITAGTIFHDSHLPLEKWFFATFLMCGAKKGISARQMHRMLGVGSYKTAWYLCHRIRAAMKEELPARLKGVIEADETYVGGRARGAGKGHYHDTKAIILGAVQRGGPIRLKVAKDNRKRTLHQFIQANVDPDAKLYTDEWPGYNDLPNRETVNHRAKEYVRADVHTNSVESVWSLFKRSIVGSYHHLSEKHMQSYLDEINFRFNRRKSEELFIETLRALVQTPTLTFKKLTGELEPQQSAAL
jgi:transposase-like protein